MAPRQPSSRSSPPPVLRLALALVLAVLLLHPGRAGRPPTPAAAALPSTWVVDTGRRGAVEQHLPAHAFPGQKKPPCDPDEAELLKACWVEVKKAPPCGPKWYQHGASCFGPVLVAPRPVSEQ